MISVIIPYDKDRGYLAECIASIEAQDQEHEIILAQGNKPVAMNFNDGLLHAKGKYCKFVCEDDYLPPDALRLLREGIKDNYWIFANAIQKDSTEWIYRPGDQSREFMSLKENIRTNRIHGGTTLYRTAIVRSVGGMDESLWTGEEYDMHLKMWSRGFKPGYIDKEVYVHRLWSGQKSRILRKTNKQKRDEAIKKIQARYHDSL